MGYGYHRVMGFWAEFSAYQVGGLKQVWNFSEYGLSQRWIKTESTVHLSSNRTGTVYFPDANEIVNGAWFVV